MKAEVYVDSRTFNNRDSISAPTRSTFGLGAITGKALGLNDLVIWSELLETPDSTLITPALKGNICLPNSINE